ncbi:uncharacterized protein BT62DRAFT_912768 [Guyanagaster necrorhizus]|uniref:C2H2-type domain-containing protein n=1 Tax=Guyanagaster necrorhizus TaxID=856835 RepID=A0A9P7VGS1_9AGAR|nr:uncharacterized protein BT62DRAFT_912768 [Guyanagaster necrorhizus MCA 3950]KAG7439694.1 hypothetical protein BT62DRAFT_912768 [Guyanagaster necrorhizus MCA 3950]
MEKTHSDASPIPQQPSSEDDNSEESKKHICATCKKRFSRPSSLIVHINTHTGAMPYRCSLPGCGKEFNVKSNMVRHYRSHMNPGIGRSATSRHNLPTKNPYPQIHPWSISEEVQNSEPQY